MRVYIPPGTGLGAPDLSALRRMSDRSKRLIADEIGHPESHETIRWILRQRDPEAALADAVTENIRQASGASSGLGDGLGRSFFKRLAKLHSRILHSIVRIHKKIDPGLHMLTKKKHRGHSGPPIANPPAPPPDPGSSATPAPMPAPMPPPIQAPDPSYQMQTQGPVNYVQEQPPPDPSASAQAQAPSPATAPDASAAAQAPAPPPPSTAPATSPPFTTGTDETAGLPSASGYTLTVEGQAITNYPVDITQLSSIVQSGTQPGDRFEILADGVGTGLRVRTTSGFISIPDSLRAQVMAMPRGQVLALLTQAASNVAAAGGPSGPPPVPPPSSGGNGVLWLLGAGGAAVAAMSMGGKRR